MIICIDGKQEEIMVDQSKIKLVHEYFSYYPLTIKLAS